MKGNPQSCWFESRLHLYKLEMLAKDVSLLEYMPNISDIAARMLALLFYYMELLEGKSPTINRAIGIVAYMCIQHLSQRE